jgi:hypothetical protein
MINSNPGFEIPSFWFCDGSGDRGVGENQTHN